MTLASMITAIRAVNDLAKKVADNDISAEKYIENGNNLIWKRRGSMLEMIADTIIEPTIIVSKDLKDNEYIEDVIGSNVNMFASFLMQSFNYAVGLGKNEPLTTLSLLTSGKISYSTEDDYISPDGAIKRLDYQPKFLPINSNTVSLEAEKISLENEDGWSHKTTKTERKSGIKLGKDDVLPLTMTKTIELTIDTTGIQDTKNQKAKVKVNETSITKAVIPITIRANIIYTDFENILNMVAPNGSGTTFYERFMEWRSGGISFWKDLVFCQDLIEQYKRNKIKDTDDLIKLMNDRKYDADSKFITDGVRGKGAYHSTLIINEDQVDRLNAALGARVYKKPEKLFEATSSLIFTTVDEDYGRANFLVKDIGSRSDVTLKSLKSKKGGDNDLNSIFKSLLANKPITF